MLNRRINVLHVPVRQVSKLQFAKLDWAKQRMKICLTATEPVFLNDFTNPGSHREEVDEAISNSIVRIKNRLRHAGGIGHAPVIIGYAHIRLVQVFEIVNGVSTKTILVNTNLDRSGVLLKKPIPFVENWLW
jgi:hypothetical protein